MAQNKMTLEDIHAELLEQLRDIVAVCNRHGIKYNLMCGSLLGVVRHKGFIPWDDDIDIGMLRADYERFLTEAPALLPEYYFLQTARTDPAFPHNFAKIRDSRTTFIETLTHRLPIHHGVFIDIFPFDPYPESALQARMLEYRRKILKSRIDQAFHYDHPITRSPVGKTLLWAAERLYPTVPDAVRARERLYTAPRTGDRVTNFCGIWGDREIVPREWLTETCELEFEGFRAKCPAAYDRYLTNVYGDYMQLPPVEKRVTHHFTERIDLHRPYTDYTETK